MSTDPLPLAEALIRAESVTPAGPEVFDIVERTLAGAGFAVERMSFASEGTTPVENLFATRGSGRHLAFAGHVDVVPPGAVADWTHPPFSAAIDGDTLYGRGAQDMKGAVAAMIAAALDWAAADGPGQISFLITGDEEGVAINGTMPLLEWAAAHTRFDAAIVGEPTARAVLGDTIKIGRRGSLSAAVTVEGKQGHVAYQERAENPVPALLAIGTALNLPLDEGSEHFAPTNLEIVSVDVGNPSWNVIPPRASLRFNVRFNDHWTFPTLQAELTRRIEEAAAGARVSIAWEPFLSDCFLTRDEALVAAVTDAVEQATGVRPEATTGGGTSDARFIKNYCPVVEFGGVGSTMHQVDERTSVTELRTLANAYRAIIAAVLSA
ncbi:succinyl-diaminopimelate desuccinylase [Acuticoccus mangrovi]|uniref:Succinyl-diaminopimelate desuccinylase n=1 Tax=Acuticoccus mangrovi TaxID=2796142 RepID=A0A934MFW9_9HYPH|nr:succinyl-diaminopimelate desuccinylase [Acuticoccus mangrovi]MBJ3775375.1 succinyl-diaminopimelate desuccinylase [Acuticoccus mangrovi]